MRKLIPMFTAIILIALAGCKSESVSRTYSADMDTTWAAALRAAEKMSNQKPSKADRENGKIVTGWIYSNVSIGPEGDVSTTRSTDIWQGIITLKQAGAASTKVTVKVKKGYASTENSPDIESRGSDSIGYTLGSNDTELQNKFLNKLAEELAPK